MNERPAEESEREVERWHTALGPTIAASARFHDLVVVPRTGSTQTEARDRRAPAGTVVTTLRQHGGRGRLGHHWADTGHEGLALSVVLPAFGASLEPRPERLAIGSAVAAAEAIESVLGREVGLKWPNDVMAEGRKLAGVLIEGGPGGIVIGIGVNVGQTSWPPELAGRAISLRELGAAVDRPVLAGRLVAALDGALGRDDEDLSRAFGARDVLQGRRLRFRTPEGIVAGVVNRVEPLRGLGVTPDGEREPVWLAAATTRILADC